MQQKGSNKTVARLGTVVGSSATVPHNVKKNWLTAKGVKMKDGWVNGHEGWGSTTIGKPGF